MEMTKTQLKRTAKAKLEKATGLTVKLNQIVLLEAYGDGKYILFQAGSLYYAYNCNAIFGESLSIYPTDELVDGMAVRF